jgi:hypothetical protein
MPLLYGEGSRSFIRLQEEIIKSGHDFTLFAWSNGEIFDSIPRSNTDQTLTYAPDSELCGLLANSPALFAFSTEVVPLEEDFEDLRENIVIAGGVVIRLPTFMEQDRKFAALPCLYKGKYVSFPLRFWHDRFAARELILFTAETNHLYTAKGELRLRTLFLKAPTAGPIRALAPTPVVTHTVKVDITAQEIPEIGYYRSPFTGCTTDPFAWELPPNHAGLHLMCIVQPQVLGSIEGWDTAVIVGGKASTKDGLWIAAVPILSRKETDDSFHKLLSIMPELIRCCTTFDHLRAELDSGANSTLFARQGQTSVSFVAGVRTLVQVPGFEPGQPVQRTRKFTRHVILEAKLKEEYRHSTRRAIKIIIQNW